MTKAFNLSLFYTVGKTGDEANAKTETLDMSWDTDLSDEENQANLELRAKIVQMRLQAHVTELLADSAPEFMKTVLGEES